MSSIGKTLRDELEKHFTLDRPEVVTEQVSVRRHPQMAAQARERT